MKISDKKAPFGKGAFDGSLLSARIIGANIFCRIHKPAVDNDFKVAMITRSVAGHPYISNDLPLLDIITVRHCQLAHVGI